MAVDSDRHRRIPPEDPADHEQRRSTPSVPSCAIPTRTPSRTIKTIGLYDPYDPVNTEYRGYVGYKNETNGDTTSV